MGRTCWLPAAAAAMLAAAGFAYVDLRAQGAGDSAALPPAAQSASAGPSSVEPDFETAAGWWSDIRNICTPVGWREHAFRFNVLFDGTLLVEPKRHLERLGGNRGVQLTFAPVTDDMRPGKQLSGLGASADDDRVMQGWTESRAPVLRSEWVVEGLVFNQEVFAHVHGARAVETGVEPLFAWVRLSIRDSIPGLPLPRKAGFAIKINAPFVTSAMSPGQNMRFWPERAKYPGPLTASPGYERTTGFRVFEGEKVRLGVAPGPQCDVELRPGKPAATDSSLVVLAEARAGSRVDLLIPLAPVPAGEFDRELAVGYDPALAEANRYWSEQPSTAAVFHVPEKPINEAIERNLQMTQVIAEKDPRSGDYSLLSGSWIYSQGVWGTPAAFALSFLDLLGRHAQVERYLEVFKRSQGMGAPPGPAFKPHPGYLSTPRTLQSVDWVTDHGALLWAAAEHALLTDDARFIEAWLPAIVRACEFVKDARRIGGHGGVPGILPPAVSSDWKTVTQTVWNDAWTYKGLVTAARLLHRVRHPRAAEFAAEAKDYRNVFQAAFREAAHTAPTWKDASGRVHPVAPYASAGQTAWEARSATPLDTGALSLVFAGLVDAGDDLIQSTLLWFREGPPRRFYRPDSDWALLPSLHHEMASSEPCYSWNIFASWQLGDRPRFLEGMYSLFAGAYSRQTYSVCETRGGITGCTHWLPSVMLARLAVIDDQVADGELHLLRLMPLAWLQQGKPATFERMPTEFGPVTLRVEPVGGGKELSVAFVPRFRTAPSRVVLHVPPLRGLEGIRLNGRALAWDGRARQLDVR